MNEHANGDLSANTPPAIGRRGLLQSAAWAAPVVALATAAPAYAASTPLSTKFVITGAGMWGSAYDVTGKPTALTVQAGGWLSFQGQRPQVHGLTFVFGLPTHRVAGTATIAQGESWAPTGVTVVGDRTLFTFAYGKMIPPDPSRLEITVPLKGNAPGPSQTRIVGTITAGAPSVTQSSESFFYDLP